LEVSSVGISQGYHEIPYGWISFDDFLQLAVVAFHVIVVPRPLLHNASILVPAIYREEGSLALLTCSWISRNS